MDANTEAHTERDNLTAKLGEIDALLTTHIEKKQSLLSNIEKREHIRVDDLLHRLKIIDKHTNATLGYISNISLGGLCLVSNRPIPQNEVFLLQIEVGIGESFSKAITLEAFITRLNSQRKDGCYECGFSFAHLSADDTKSLNRIIRILELDKQLEQMLTDITKG